MSEPKQLMRIQPGSDCAQATPISTDRLISGTPLQLTENLFTNTQANVFCGVWSSDGGKWDLNYTEDEFCYGIKGAAIVSDQNGCSETLRTGDAFVIPAGFIGSWETVGEVQKFYAIYQAPAE